jgi:hypothetical protein
MMLGWLVFLCLVAIAGGALVFVMEWRFKSPSRTRRLLMALAMLQVVVAAVAVIDVIVGRHSVPEVLTVPPSSSSNIEQKLALGLAVPNDPEQGRKLARAVASKLKDYPAEYNRPRTLWLRESTPVQLAIKTDAHQSLEPYFKDFEGEVTSATIRAARDMSAQLTGPPDRLQIELRGDKMRSILSPTPITWIWDVNPLKPGKAPVILEVTSYIKTGKDTEPVPIRVLQDTWVVEVRGIEWVKYQIEQIEPIRAFLFAVAGGGTAVLAWFGLKGWGRRHTDFES